LQIESSRTASAKPDAPGVIVSVKGVSKNFNGAPAVRDTSFTIMPGACFGLLGPNGAGKSTLIRMLYGAMSRSGGEIRVLGLDPETGGRELRRSIGVVTQEDALDEQMTVLENMALYASFIGLPKSIAKTRIRDLLAFLALEHKVNAKIIALSGGMKRRLVFVRALLGNPQLLILDEPTTGLDPAVRQVLWTKIRALQQQGTTVLLTTHYMDEAEALCDQLVILDRGVVRVSGAPRDLIAEHSAGYVAIWKTALHPRLEAASLHQLTAAVDQIPNKPDVIRPANLEDVFLKITGKELSGDA